MLDPYIIIISASVLIALSYVFDKFSKIVKVPSVLFLIFTGIIVHYTFGDLVREYEATIMTLLELFGIIGLIMIVLEAAVDLKLSREKTGLIGKSLGMALLVLIITSVGIAYILKLTLNEGFFNSLVYAIPLSVVSSAVLIPSVHSLTQQKKEFMIYESTFSDIAGIMFFNYVVIQSGRFFSLPGLGSLLLTIVVSIVVSYLLVFFFSKLRTGAKIFLMIAILALLYSIGKQLHLSSLLIILIFGLVLNNSKLFFRGKLANSVNFYTIDDISIDFRIITSESAFVVRTFFFVVFGMSIDLSVLLDLRVVGIGTSVVLFLYLVRYVNFKLLLKTNAFPEIFLAPRGLITILLFYSIPAAYMIQDFSIGILFFVILATSVVMSAALIMTREKELEDLTHREFDGINPFDPVGPFCEIDDSCQPGNELKYIENIKEWQKRE